MVIGTWAVTAIIDQLGGDPEGDVMQDIQTDQGIRAAEAQRPLHRLQRGTQEDEKEFNAGLRERSSSAIRYQQNRVGPDSDDSGSLDRIAAEMGVTAEELSAKLSPERAGDMGDASRIAYGRSAKRMKG